MSSQEPFVYVLTFGYPYEPTDIVGVFTTLEQAKIELHKQFFMHNHGFCDEIIDSISENEDYVHYGSKSIYMEIHRHLLNHVRD